MYILLPKRVDGLNQLLANISPFTLRRALWQLEETSVAVTLPTFKFDFMTDLRKVLTEVRIIISFISQRCKCKKVKYHHHLAFTVGR